VKLYLAHRILMDVACVMGITPSIATNLCSGGIVGNYLHTAEEKQC